MEWQTILLSCGPCGSIDENGHCLMSGRKPDLPTPAILYLRAHRRRNVVLGPLLRDERGAWSYAAHDEAGRHLHEFYVRRLEGGWSRAEACEPTSVVTEPHVYGGVIANHFGHFLVETLSRMWWIKRRKDIRTVWHSQNGKLHRWQKDIFRLFSSKKRE